MPSLNYSCDMGSWSSFFQEARRRVGDLTPVHMKIGEYLTPKAQDNFETNGGRVTWEPLKDSTLTPKRLAYGNKPLLKTTALQRSMTYDAQPQWCDVGTAIAWAKAQFFGRRDGRCPARSPFEFVAGVLEPIGDLYAAFILGTH